MSVWKLHVPIESRYAALDLLYQQPLEMEVCEACGRRIRKDSGPLRVEWVEGSAEIGDFTYCRGALVVKETVAEELIRTFPGLAKGVVEMPDHPNLRKPSHPEQKSVPRVWLPYEGPPLCRLKVLHEVDIDPISTVEIDYTCEECGVVRYSRLIGIERKTSRRHTSRAPDKGLFFRRSAIGKSEIFLARHTGLHLCTDLAKEFIEKKQYSNVEFLEVGDVIPDGERL